MESQLARRRAALAQSGFTLVELITVIIILGVLAAVAIPRYADLQSKARIAKVNAVAGSIKAAGGLVKAQALANAMSCSTAAADPGVTMEGTNIAINYCYPQALGAFTTGVLAAANVSATDGWAISTGSGLGGGATAGSTVVIELADGATPANCSISYTSPTAANTAPAIPAPTTTGC